MVSAIDRPMPRLDPVMMATLPDRSMIGALLNDVVMMGALPRTNDACHWRAGQGQAAG
jgi:hypothetical protein